MVTKHGVTLIGYTNLPALVAADASALYARNVLDFTRLIFDADGKFVLNLGDEIIKACVMLPAEAAANQTALA
jgi:NAD(P) transhydrogenase subunit alpha